MLKTVYNKIYHKIYRETVDRPHHKDLIKKLRFIGNDATYYFKKFGNKNKDKIFYVIKIYEKNKEGGGLFSNLLFILQHLKIADKLGVIPVVDMENFLNRYNEINKINGNKNSWLYYFAPVSKYTLGDVYQSQNVLITNGFFSNNMSKNFYNDKSLKKIFEKYIKIKKKFILNANNFYRKNLKGNKVLGVHFRGTDRINVPNHPLPPTVEQMFNLVDAAIKRYKEISNEF